MRNSRPLLAVLVALVLSLVLLQTLLAPQPVLAITGERPTYAVGDRWTYNLELTNTSNNATTSTPFTLLISEAKNILDYNNASKYCYFLRYQPALDPFTIILLYSEIFNSLSIDEFVEVLKNNSYSEFYITKSGYELVGIHIYLYFFDNSHGVGVNLNVTVIFEEEYPYLLKFPLEINSTFGGYVEEELGCRIQGYLSIYNSTSGKWNNMSLDSETSLSQDFLFFLFPLVNVTRTENITVPAGTFECWKMEHLRYPEALCIWYSPEAKNIARLNISIEGVITYTSSLEDYRLTLVTPEQQMLILFYLSQQSPHQLVLLIGIGGLATVLTIAATTLLARKRRK